MMGANAVIVRDIMRSTLSQLSRKVLLPLCLSGWMVSCSPLNPMGWAQDYLDIAKLNEISNQRTVNLQGIVVNVAPFLEGGAYQIQDKTGKVWIKTDGELPKKGAVVTVKGEVAYEAIFIGPEKLGESYVIEIGTPKPTETAATPDANSAAPADAPSTDETAAVTMPPESNSATTPETTPVEAVDSNAATTGNAAIAVMESQPQTIAVEAPEETSETPEKTKDPDNGAAALTPTPQTSPSAPPKAPPKAPAPPAKTTSLPIANPKGTRPTGSPTPAPAKSRVTVDDQFLPHKRLTK